MLSIREYEVDVSRTMVQHGPIENNLHALSGLMSEVGEVASLFQHQIQDGTHIDEEKLTEELGDILFFVTELCWHNFLRLEDVLEVNMEKRRQRYPDGFDPEKSRKRHEIDAQDMPNYITTTGAARDLGVTPNTIRRFMRDGRLPYKQFGGQRMINREVWEKWKEVNR